MQWQLLLLWGVLTTLTFAALCVVLLPLRHVFVQRAQRVRFYRYVWMIGGGVPFCALGLYVYFGASGALTHYWAVQAALPKARDLIARLHGPDQLIEAFKLRLQQAPRRLSNIKGWYLLGRLYLSQQRYQEAAQAFQHACQLYLNAVKSKGLSATSSTLPVMATFFVTATDHRIGGINPTTLIIYWARARFLAAGQQLPLDVKRTLEQVLHGEPQCAPALNLLALNAYTHQHYDMAIRYWERLLPQLPERSEGRRAVLKMIGISEQKLTQMNVNANIMSTEIVPW